ncbi:hypothetical protein JCM8547_005269 [Rhodosporidiobolus lusitaniae]
MRYPMTSFLDLEPPARAAAVTSATPFLCQFLILAMLLAKPNKDCLGNLIELAQDRAYKLLPGSRLEENVAGYLGISIFTVASDLFESLSQTVRGA